MGHETARTKIRNYYVKLSLRAIENEIISNTAANGNGNSGYFNLENKLCP
jgi:hypothetical protein